MARFGWLAALFGGCLIGAAAVIAWNSLAFYPPLTPLDDHRDLLSGGRLSDTELARALMDRVAPTFVASERGRSAREGVFFFTEPLPFGENLCRVDIVSFPAKIIRGRADRYDSRWDDNLTLHRAYGVWSANTAKGETRDAACAHYRDFQHLVLGDGLAIDRIVNVLAKAIAALRAGRGDFHAGCAAPKGGRVISCNVSRASILSLSPADFAQVESQTEQRGNTSTAYVDVLTTRGHPDGHGCVDFSRVQIESRQTYRTESLTNPDLVDLEFLPGGPVC